MNKAKAYNKAVRIAAKTTREAAELAKANLINMLSDKQDPEVLIEAAKATGEFVGQLELICELFDVSEKQLEHDINKELNEEE